MKSILSCAPESVPATTTEVTDKRGYARRWLFSPRKVDNLIAEGLPHLKIGSRRVRIVVEEADRWMWEKYGIQRCAVAK